MIKISYKKIKFDMLKLKIKTTRYYKIILKQLHASKNKTKQRL